MLYRTTIVVNVLSLFFQIYNIEGVEKNICVFRFALMTLMYHVTEWSILPYTFQFHTIDITKYIINHS